MPNPFPGVNPHIEATGDLWVGFHNRLITHISEMLNASILARGYAALVEKRIDLVDATLDVEQRLPDVLVTRPARWPDSGDGGSATAFLDLEPATIDLPRFETAPLAFIEIRHLPGQRLVTGIELLSPSNKSGRGRDEYAAKRAGLLVTPDVNLVEVDLLLGGRRPDMIGRVPPGEFCAFVSRAERRPKAEAYAWSIRHALPRLPIPLKPGDADATLDLAAAYRTTYDGGPYELVLPYDRSLPGDLSDPDRAWVAGRVAAR